MGVFAAHAQRHVDLRPALDEDLCIDEGIADLTLALNQAGWTTADSCAGDEHQAPHVSFASHEIAVEVLAELSRADAAVTHLGTRMRMYGGHGPRGFETYYSLSLTTDGARKLLESVLAARQTPHPPECRST